MKPSTSPQFIAWKERLKSSAVPFINYEILMFCECEGLIFFFKYTYNNIIMDTKNQEILKITLNH